MKVNKFIHVGGTYAILTGDYVGEMWICIEKGSKNFNFLSVPKNINREASIEKLDFALSNDIIEYVEDIPTDMIAILKEQYKYNEIPTNRRKQSSLSNLVDCEESAENS